MICVERGAESTARVTGGRLHPDAIGDASIMDLAVGHAIERHASGQHEIALAGAGQSMTCEAQHYFLGHHLDRCGDVHVPDFEPGIGPTWRPAKECMEALVSHNAGAREVEIGKIERKRTVVADIDQLLLDERCVPWFAVGCEAH